VGIDIGAGGYKGARCIEGDKKIEGEKKNFGENDGGIVGGVREEVEEAK
jgi:hypothetical protein